MRGLTVQQPWAWAIVHGGKDVENRTIPWSYRGPLAIHAGTRISKRGSSDDRIIEALIRGPGLTLDRHERPGGVTLGPGASVEMETGAVIGVCELADAHEDVGCCRPWGESSYEEHGGRRRTRLFHLRLEEIQPLERPVFVHGRLGLWHVPDELARRIAEVATA